jgi:hypothetical protein
MMSRDAGACLCASNCMLIELRQVKLRRLLPKNARPGIFAPPN